MADNITLSSGSGGDSLAADDISSVKHQRVKIQHGADGSATDVSTASPMPVELDSQALTAVLHSITAKLATDVLQNGLTALTPKFAKIDVTATATIVAAVAGKKIRVLALVMTLDLQTGDEEYTFKSGAAGTALTGTLAGSTAAAANYPIEYSFCPVGHFETASGSLLELSIAGTTPEANGSLVYIEV